VKISVYGINISVYFAPSMKQETLPGRQKLKREERMTVADFAKVLGCTRKHLGNVLAGRDDASKKLAINLGKRTKSQPAVWVFGTATERSPFVQIIKAMR
jgi:DNA-binding XRE family transcriptional regulator